MEMSGERQINAPREAVWAALNDPDVLKACIPGCQEMTRDGENGFAATVKQKVGPVSATFKGAVALSNVVAGESYTISGEGKGGAAGFAKVSIAAASERISP
ncbi:MAG: carbon monoxide dehydrogenase subunit G, partial [Pseudomonadota bacterium]